MIARTIVFFGTLFLVFGCTSVKVEPVANSYNIKHICIKNNPKVIVDGFLDIVEDRIQYHGITTEVMDFVSPSCEYKLTYTALRSWDFTPYLSHAELRLFKDNKRIAYREFHLNGKGGLAFTKWNSVETKMNPVIDQMFGNRLTNR